MHTVVFTPFGGTGVALFLFISGYGLSESYKKNGLSNYWKKKILRVLIPYFIVISLLYIFSYDFTWWRYLLDILGLKTHYWYIAFQMKWYIAFWFFSLFFLKYRACFLALMAIIILFLFPNIEAEQAFSFFAGCMASNKIEYLKKLSSEIYVKLAIISFIVGTFFLAIKQIPSVRACDYEFVLNIVQCGIKLPYAVSIICFLKLFPKLIESRFLVFTGMISYELYLVQMPFYSDLNGTVLMAVGFIIACYACAYVFYVLNKNIVRLIQ